MIHTLPALKSMISLGRVLPIQRSVTLYAPGRRIGLSSVSRGQRDTQTLTEPVAPVDPLTREKVPTAAPQQSSEKVVPQVGSQVDRMPHPSTSHGTASSTGATSVSTVAAAVTTRPAAAAASATTSSSVAPPRAKSAATTTARPVAAKSAAKARGPVTITISSCNSQLAAVTDLSSDVLVTEAEKEVLFLQDKGLPARGPRPHWFSEGKRYAMATETTHALLASAPISPFCDGRTTAGYEPRPGHLSPLSSSLIVGAPRPTVPFHAAIRTRRGRTTLKDYLARCVNAQFALWKLQSTVDSFTLDTVSRVYSDTINAGIRNDVETFDHLVGAEASDVLLRRCRAWYTALNDEATRRFDADKLLSPFCGPLYFDLVGWEEQFANFTQLALRLTNVYFITAVSGLCFVPRDFQSDVGVDYEKQQATLLPRDLKMWRHVTEMPESLRIVPFRDYVLWELECTSRRHLWCLGYVNPYDLQFRVGRY